MKNFQQVAVTLIMLAGFGISGAFAFRWLNDATFAGVSQPDELIVDGGAHTRSAYLHFALSASTFVIGALCSFALRKKLNRSEPCLSC